MANHCQPSATAGTCVGGQLVSSAAARRQACDYAACRNGTSTPRRPLTCRRAAAASPCAGFDPIPRPSPQTAGHTSQTRLRWCRCARTA